MSGSLLPLKTSIGPGTSLYAPASSGGGGGGGSTSSISNGTTYVVCDPSGITMGATDFITASAVGINLNNTWFTNPANLSTQALEVSSINGLQYPPGQSDFFSTLYTSSIGATPSGGYMTVVSDMIVDPSYQLLGGGSNAGTGASINGFNTIGCGNLETTAVNPAYGVSNIPIGASVSVNGISSIGSIVGTGDLVAPGIVSLGNVSCSGISTTNHSATNIIASNVFASTISRLGNPQGAFPAPASATQGLLPLGIPGTAQAGSYTNMIQGGYVANLPYLGVVPFTYPYQADNTPICVQLTATTQNVTGGANPNISLNAGWGYAGTGVSSIGFSVDARNGGVGYTASFYWLAYPATQ